MSDGRAARAGQAREWRGADKGQAQTASVDKRPGMAVERMPWQRALVHGCACSRVCWEQAARLVCSLQVYKLVHRCAPCVDRPPPSLRRPQPPFLSCPASSPPAGNPSADKTVLCGAAYEDPWLPSRLTPKLLAGIKEATKTGDYNDFLWRSA